MVLIDELFIGETVEDLSTIIYSLKKGIPVFNIYCVCFNEDSHNILEILNTNELLKKRNNEKNYKVIGIAGGKYEAYDLVRYIFQFANDNNIEIENIGKELSRKAH